MAEVIATYPWERLPHAARDESQLNRAALAALESLRLSAAETIARELFAAELGGFGVTRRRIVKQARLPPLTARLETRAMNLAVTCEPALVSFALTRLLDRPSRVESANTPLEPSLLGAWHALLLEIGRRLSAEEPPRLETSLDAITFDRALSITAWIRIDDRSYDIEVLVPSGAPRVCRLLNDVPVTLGLVVGQAVVARSELGHLRIGDAWLLGEGWFVTKDGKGNAIAASPSQELGFELQLAGSITYRGLRRLPHEPQESGAMETKEQKAPEPPTQESVIMDAPVVVRVEVGSLTMNAREWMALRPGDVLSCGLPPGSPAVLRVAGTELARGELVTIDGELGVRITQIVDERASTHEAAPTTKQVRT